MRLFLEYRSACVTDRALWATILDENAMLVLPVTPYRSFNRAEYVDYICSVFVNTTVILLWLLFILIYIYMHSICRIHNCARMIVGIDAIVADTSSVALLAESIGLNSEAWKYAIKRSVKVKLTIDYLF